MSASGLEQRIAQLEDIEAIKKLKANYCLHVDHANEEGWVALFTEDAVWDSDKFGRFEGREAIRGLFRHIPEMLYFAIHYVMNPIIEVDGNRATGIWYLLEPCTFAKGEQAAWGAARYDEEYVKVGGQWKFKRLKLGSWFWTAFDQGWAKRRYVTD
jgi:ketosteroid isomerase-like protein